MAAKRIQPYFVIRAALAGSVPCWVMPRMPKISGPMPMMQQ